MAGYAGGETQRLSVKTVCTLDPNDSNIYYAKFIYAPWAEYVVTTTGMDILRSSEYNIYEISH